MTRFLAPANDACMGSAFRNLKFPRMKVEAGSVHSKRKFKPKIVYLPGSDADPPQISFASVVVYNRPHSGGAIAALSAMALCVSFASIAKAG